MDIGFAVAVVIFFLLAEGFFSGSEFTLISFSRIKLRHMAESGVKGAGILDNLLKKPEKVFGTTSVGTNICVFAGASIVTALMARKVSADQADLYSFLIMGPVTLILGEIVPKMITRQYAEKIIPYIAFPLAVSQKFFAPILFVTTALSNLILKLFLGMDEVPAKLVTREEILKVTKMSEERLDLEHEERKMLHRIFEFKMSSVDTAMQPLINVAAVQNSATLNEAKSMIAETGYSRLPVFHERIYNIVGIISAFDILRYPDHNATVDKVMQQVFYTPETKRNSILLKEMQEAQAHMAVVVDEYGGTVGIVTIEDLIEEIVGEIEDEFDSPVKFYEKAGEGRYIIDAMMEVDSVNEQLGVSLPTGDYETVSGFLNDALERIPHKREMVAVGPYLITVLDATQKNVKSVELLDLTKTGHAPETKNEKES